MVNNSRTETRWEQLLQERAAARASGVFACLGSNRVPETDSVDVESENAVQERIRYIVSHSTNSMM